MRSIRKIGCRKSFLTSGAALLFALAAAAGEWTQYRGPNHNGISAERINKNWGGAVTNPVWQIHLVNGLTSFTVAGGRALTQIHRDINGEDKEVCLALSVADGSELWATPVDTADYPNGGVGFTDDGPRSTPIGDGGSVYVLSSFLQLHRLNAATGDIIWSTNLISGFGGSVIAWQNAASPVLENGLLFVNANCGTESLMAFNASNGALVWRSQNEAMTHSTPVLTTMHSTRQLIFATQSGLVALNPQTGSLLWKFTHPFSYGISLAASPAVYQDTIFLTASYGMGAYAVKIFNTNGTPQPGLLWKDSTMESHWSTPVCFQGTVCGQFTPDNADAELRCIDIFTGQTKWAVGGFGRGGVTLVGTNLLIITESGALVLAEANTNAFSELARFIAIPDIHPYYNKCWNALALSEGQVYVRSTAYAARFDLSVPALKLDSPTFVSGNKLNLAIRTVTGTPLTIDRLTGMQLRSATNAALPPALWTALTNTLGFNNGVVTVTNVDAAAPRRFFMVTETD